MISSPTWSVMIPTYNAARYLVETLESVIAQGYAHEVMEIVVVDNCSTDNTKEIVEVIGRGRIKWFQNPVNIGMMNNFNKCIELAQGELLHILNADDVVNLGYYKGMAEVFAKHDDVYLVSCDSQIIDEYGSVQSVTDNIEALLTPSNSVEDLVTYNKFRTPGVTVRKKAYEKVGGFDPILIQNADWDMWLRVISGFKGIHINAPLCKYRVHSDNGSSRVLLTGENIVDTERIYDKFIRLGYPVKKEFQKKTLVAATRAQYLYFYHSNNEEGMRNLMKIYKRLAGRAEVVRLELLCFLMSSKRMVKKVLAIS